MIQNKNKAQFNLLDALIVILMLGLIGVVVYSLVGGFGKTDDKEPTAITFDVKISNVKETTLPVIMQGIAVRDSVTGKEIGTVVSVRTEKSRYYGGVHADESGNYVLGVTEYPDEYDVYVTISATANADDRNIFYVGNTRMIIGETVYFQVKSFSAVSYIVKTDIPG